MKQNYKIINDKRGFTLVELLAVIVVLAIVMLLAVQAVLPQMTIARKNSFAIEANGAIEAATSYVVTKALTENLIVPSDSKGLCVKVETLADGFYKADTSRYWGYVIITQKESGSNTNYLYKVYLQNGQYMANGLGLDESGTSNVNIVGDDIQEYNSSSLPKTYPEGCK